VGGGGGDFVVGSGCGMVVCWCVGVGCMSGEVWGWCVGRWVCVRVCMIGVWVGVGRIGVDEKDRVCVRMCRIGMHV